MAERTQDLLTRYLKETILSDEPGLELGEDDNLLLSGQLDSMGVMRLVGFIEEEFGVKVPPEDLTIENFATINVIAGYVDNLKLLGS